MSACACMYNSVYNTVCSTVHLHVKCIRTHINSHLLGIEEISTSSSVIQNGITTTFSTSGNPMANMCTHTVIHTSLGLKYTVLQYVISKLKSGISLNHHSDKIATTKMKAPPPPHTHRSVLKYLTLLIVCKESYIYTKL